MEALDSVVEHFSSLPTIGKKTARRLAFHLLREPLEQVQLFADALVRMRESVRECEVCNTFTDAPVCALCASDKRDRSVICVVEQPTDVMAIERTGDYRGMYHVLHGALNPLDGVGPDDIRLQELMSRLGGGLTELILALNPTVEGEVTTQYIARMASPLSITITRIARGIPVGADLEFADDATLSRAFEGRVRVTV
ncbi:MAG: recombination protein RecR [Chlorobi bacterium]|nr:MAG: recombination protein RecR [Bacteroidota bacterium]KXK35604.1 MAG: recombination protein RecR [Chlorobi bacterium OLB6]MBE2264752.1 recombination protein RecR [Flavobacteriales bacterium]MBL1161253.1 recombination protein RecR [Chlorobiota bacterium]MBW7853718.1 recombination protein RecR [Candidatus Kapabacteria bacterium]MCC6332048.1 recombination protein RecR [Ignavibacteria bacterium]